MYRTPPLCSLFAVPSGGCPRVIPSAQWWHYSHVTSFTNAFRLGWTRWVFSSPAIPSIIIHLILAHSSCWIPVNIVKVRSIFLLYIFFFFLERDVLQFRPLLGLLRSRRLVETKKKKMKTNCWRRDEAHCVPRVSCLEEKREKKKEGRRAGWVLNPYVLNSKEIPMASPRSADLSPSFLLDSA